MPAGEGWEGRESLSRQQIESVEEEERKEFRALGGGTCGAGTRPVGPCPR